MAIALTGFAAADTASWPERPIPVNPAEAVIEAFWVPTLGASQRWKAESEGKVTGLAMRGTWEAVHLSFTARPENGRVTLHRPYALDIHEYQGLLMRMITGEGVRVSIVATIDGERRPICTQAPGSNDELEFGGPLGLSAGAPGKLENLEIQFESQTPAAHQMTLHWVLVTRPGERWTPPGQPFDAMIATTNGAFEPGMGLLFDAGELDQLRTGYALPAFDAIWRQDQEQASRQYAIDPAGMIRQYMLYGVTRYGRVSDLTVDTGCDGLSLALVGLMNRNPDYMRQAARHAIVFARMEHWSEGFMDRTPAIAWTHAGFAPTVATIKASLLLDWTWNWLTPAGRALVRDAIRKKGLPYIETTKEAMANQGIRFNKGRILGTMAVTENWDSPALKVVINDSLRIINMRMNEAVLADGTFSEGMGYGKGSTASAMLSYYAASRALKQPVKDLASPRILPALTYMLDAEMEITPLFAAFAAGALGDERFAAQCVPMHLLESYQTHSPGSTAANGVEYVFFGLPNLWAPRLAAAAPAPQLSPYKAYPNGGWVFMGSDDARLPRVTFESGLWDGAGHAWKHKNAVTLTGWGRTLLLPRGHVAYADARSPYTQSTLANNTFSPGGRDQDASGVKNRGATLRPGADLGPVAIAESDGATAWRTGVTEALRRVILIRPAVVLVEDRAEFARPETGVQSWNSLSPWTTNGMTTQSATDGASMRLTCLLPPAAALTAGEDSVHRDPKTGDIVPAYRATFTLPAATHHRILTLIEAIPPAGNGVPAQIKTLEPDRLLEITQGNCVTRIAWNREPLPADRLWECDTDGSLLILVRKDNTLILAAAFDATHVKTPWGAKTGEGLITMTPSADRIN
ncbi:MAG: hypothetical protein HY343_11645 [Lentisphaerae bacterium]|nr:hypothetical protein [Lentisphaerota bacterium]